LRLRRSKKILHIAGVIPLRGVVGIFPFAALDKVSCARKSRHEPSILTANIPPAMIEVQVSINNDINIFGLKVQLRELGGESSGVIHPINLITFCVEFISDAGLHQNVLAARLDQQARQAKADAIQGVGWDFFLPQYLGNNREHLPAIEPKTSVGKSVEFECAEFHDSSINSISTPAVLAG
jgi:hypothetical protein